MHASAAHGTFSSLAAAWMEYVSRQMNEAQAQVQTLVEGYGQIMIRLRVKQTQNGHGQAWGAFGQLSCWLCDQSTAPGVYDKPRRQCSTAQADLIAHYYGLWRSVRCFAVDALLPPHQLLRQPLQQPPVVVPDVEVHLRVIKAWGKLGPRVVGGGLRFCVRSRSP